MKFKVIVVFHQYILDLGLDVCCFVDSLFLEFEDEGVICYAPWATELFLEESGSHLDELYCMPMLCGGIVQLANEIKFSKVV